MKSYKILKDHRTAPRYYRKGEVVELDKFVHRALKARGVVGPDPVDEKPQVGPSEAADDGPDESKGDGDGWLERAKAALDSGNGNDIRSALAEVSETTKWKAENINRLQAEIDKRKGQ